MKSIYNYIISPIKRRYNNSIDVAGGEIIVNTDISNHQYISREATVLSVPAAYNSPIKVGDDVIVHHNIFRRWYDVRGVEKNSGSFISETEYTCSDQQIFLYKRDGVWKGLSDYCFVAPVKETEMFSDETEMERVGIIKISNKYLEGMGLKVGDVIGFTPSSEFEFVVDGERMYKMSARDICLKRDDLEVEEYQPNWSKT